MACRARAHVCPVRAALSLASRPHPCSLVAFLGLQLGDHPEWSRHPGGQGPGEGSSHRCRRCCKQPTAEAAPSCQQLAAVHRSRETQGPGAAGPVAGLPCSVQARPGSRLPPGLPTSALHMLQHITKIGCRSALRLSTRTSPAPSPTSATSPPTTWRAWASPARPSPSPCPPGAAGPGHACGASGGACAAACRLAVFVCSCALFARPQLHCWGTCNATSLNEAPLPPLPRPAVCSPPSLSPSIVSASIDASGALTVALRAPLPDFGGCSMARGPGPGGVLCGPGGLPPGCIWMKVDRSRTPAPQR